MRNPFPTITIGIVVADVAMAICITAFTRWLFDSILLIWTVNVLLAFPGGILISFWANNRRNRRL